MIAIVLGIITLGVTIQMATVISIENDQFGKNAELITSYPENKKQSETLVVYFSRSGNTELMAMEIAKIKEAHVIRLESDSYKIGFLGWVNAMKDARNQEAVILPSNIDLSNYKTIYIGSPIWLYSPAPPVWEFVKQNDFTNKKVILFNSLNSKFEQKYIDEFSQFVSNRGGKSFQHIYIIRGRMTHQMETDQFLKEVKFQLETLEKPR